MSVAPNISVKTSIKTETYGNNGNRASATVNGTTISASYTLDDNLVVYGDNSYNSCHQSSGDTHTKSPNKVK